MESTVKSEVILSIYIISFLIGLPANLLALYAFSIKIHTKARPTDILLLNLIVSDLLFLFILPLKMHEAASDMQWHLPDYLCSITTFIFFTTIYTSSLLLMAVSVVRYLGIAFPIIYHQFLKPKHVIVSSGVIWILSGAHCTIVFFTQHHPAIPGNNSTVCYENFSPEQLIIVLPFRMEAFTVLCLIPMLTCTYCYIHSIIKLYSHPGITQMQKQKVLGMALGTLAVFLISVLPYNISHLLGYYDGNSPKWRYYSLLLCTFNTCLDPVIFYFSSSAFRLAGKKSIFKMFGWFVAKLPSHGASSDNE